MYEKSDVSSDTSASATSSSTMPSFGIPNVNMANVETGMTAAHIAAKKGNIRIIRSLMRYGGVDVNAVDNKGWTPLQYAAYYDHADVVDALLGLEVGLGVKEAQFCGGLKVTESEQEKVEVGEEDSVDKKDFALTRRNSATLEKIHVMQGQSTPRLIGTILDLLDCLKIVSADLSAPQPPRWKNYEVILPMMLARETVCLIVKSFPRNFLTDDVRLAIMERDEEELSRVERVFRDLVVGFAGIGRMETDVEIHKGFACLRNIMDWTRLTSQITEDLFPLFVDAFEDVFKVFDRRHPVVKYDEVVQFFNAKNGGMWWLISDNKVMAFDSAGGGKFWLKKDPCEPSLASDSIDFGSFFLQRCDLHDWACVNGDDPTFSASAPNHEFKWSFERCWIDETLDRVPLKDLRRGDCVQLKVGKKVLQSDTCKMVDADPNNMFCLNPGSPMMVV
ncbi:Histone-lysine N-methyltransferase ehmt2 [Phlyctochytrium planicorne]|nr:Histone-lysine N-methyltransferase ehmt2 [Phlyctochytrium planicorne]